MATTPAVTTIDALLPGVAVGDEYSIEPGSRVGRLRLRGDASIAHRDPRAATIAFTCRVFGVRTHGRLEITLTDEGRIAVEVLGLPVPGLRVEGLPTIDRPDLLVLDIEPGDEFHVIMREDQVEMVVVGLPVGEIRLALTPSG